MDWNTILSVALGGLIATLAGIINNRYQSRERDKDRLEQRREAKTQLEYELTRDDIKVIEDSVDSRLLMLDNIVMLLTKRKVDAISDSEAAMELLAITTEKKMSDASPIAKKLAEYYGQQIVSEYKNFYSKSQELLNILLNNPSSIFDNNMTDGIYSQVVISASKIHGLLREKLISIRE